jgi:hypothetical protein
VLHFVAILYLSYYVCMLTHIVTKMLFKLEENIKNYLKKWDGAYLPALFATDPDGWLTDEFARMFKLLIRI